MLGIDVREAARAAARDLETSARFEDALKRDDVAAVILCSPHAYHASQIIAAARRLASGEFGTPLAMEGNFSQDKFLALAADNWRLSAASAPVGPCRTGHSSRRPGDRASRRTQRGVGAARDLGSGFANGDTLAIMIAFASGASALLTAILATPFIGRLAVFGSRGWAELRDRAHPEHAAGWDITTARRGASPTTRCWPPHPAVRGNLESFARAAAREAPYPVSLAEMATNVATFEAIMLCALNGRIERVVS